ncbi:MAG: hydroxymethylbilane synthase [Chloroflexi bacterium]|nr:hydroxymethylbilane synthase [Chloroflexota bacterium]
MLQTTPIRIGTRRSPLARYQATLVGKTLVTQWPGLEVQYVYVQTEGDARRSEPLERLAGTGVFVKELQQALLGGTIDLAVHSLKDMPAAGPEGLAIAAVLPRADARDVLAAASSQLDQLPLGATLATSSPRRVAQLRAYRPDLQFVAVRGNVDTRLRKVGELGLQGAVLAAAGLTRLELTSWITEYLPVEVCVPQVGQGAIAVEIWGGDERLRRLVAPLDHQPTRAATTAERSFLRRLGGGCQFPIGAFAEQIGATDDSEAELVIQAFVGGAGSAPDRRGQRRGPVARAEALGAELAEALLEGASDRSNAAAGAR